MSQAPTQIHKPPTPPNPTPFHIFCFLFFVLCFTSCTPAEPSPRPSPLGQQTLDPAARQTLLTLARATLTAVTTPGKRQPLLHGITLTPRLRRKQGVFVSLYRPPLLGLFSAHPAGRLRACAGHLPPLKPLYEAVIFETRKAALMDPRFDRVSAAEAPSLAIELAVVSAPRQVQPRQIRPGEHGVELRLGHKRSTYLPYFLRLKGWDREHTLDRLGHKAGLDPAAWRDPQARLSVYEAQTFREQRR